MNKQSTTSKSDRLQSLVPLVTASASSVSAGSSPTVILPANILPITQSVDAPASLSVGVDPIGLKSLVVGSIQSSSNHPRATGQQQPSTPSKVHSPVSRRAGSTMSIPAYQFSAEQRQQIVNFRIKRDLWIRELQEVFNKIYENFIGVLNDIKVKQSIRDTSALKTAKLALRKKLRNQMREIGKIATSLSDTKDSFIHLQENMPITHYYKQNIMEMHKLLSILLKLSLDNIHLDKIKMKKRQNNKCSAPLIEEIKQSYQRVQKLKAGNKLGKVIQDQVDQYQKHHMQQKQPSIAAAATGGGGGADESVIPAVIQHEMMMVATAAGQPRQQSQHQQPVDQQQRQSQQYDPYALKSNNYGDNDHDSYDDGDHIRNDDQLLNGKFDVNAALQAFVRKKEEVENMVEKFVEDVNKDTFTFDMKYQNITEYFQKRYSLMGTYFGEDKLNHFLTENAQRAKEPRGAAAITVADEFEDLYKDLDPNNFQVDDKNIEALQRIVKINEEIRKTLIEEEHAAKMNALQNLNVEQTQQLWTSVFEKKNAQHNPSHHHAVHDSQNQLSSSQKQNELNNSRQTNIKADATSTVTGAGGKQQFFFGSATSSSGFYPTKQAKADELQELRIYHDYIHRNVNHELHPSNPSLKPITTAAKGRFKIDNIKFLPVADSQKQTNTNIVSSNFFIEREAMQRKLKAAEPKWSAFKNTDSSTNQFAATGISGDSFRKTFIQQRSGYLSSSTPTSAAKLRMLQANSPPGTTSMSSTAFDLKVMFPQSTTNSTTNAKSQSNYLFPKQRDVLSFEEEMRLASSQTKSETPLYLNKFNAHNYSYAMPSSSKNKQKQRGSTSEQTRLALVSTPQIISPSSSQLQQQYSSARYEENRIDLTTMKSQESMSKSKPTEIKIEDKVTPAVDAAAAAQEKKSKKYLKDEISPVFRHSQRDMLFKINGPHWRPVSKA